jgi:hypothetical protein
MAELVVNCGAGDLRGFRHHSDSASAWQRRRHGRGLWRWRLGKLVWRQRLSQLPVAHDRGAGVGLFPGDDWNGLHGDGGALCVGAGRSRWRHEHRWQACVASGARWNIDSSGGWFGRYPRDACASERCAFYTGRQPEHDTGQSPIGHPQVVPPERVRIVFDRRRGGIGRHTILRGWRRKPCEFESHRRHHVVRNQRRCDRSQH